MGPGLLTANDQSFNMHTVDDVENSDWKGIWSLAATTIKYILKLVGEYEHW